jgi:hypothetical protein
MFIYIFILIHNLAIFLFPFQRMGRVCIGFKFFLAVKLPLPPIGCSGNHGVYEYVSGVGHRGRPRGLVSSLHQQRERGHRILQAGGNLLYYTLLFRYRILANFLEYVSKYKSFFRANIRSLNKIQKQISI